MIVFRCRFQVAMTDYKYKGVWPIHDEVKPHFIEKMKQVQLHVMRKFVKTPSLTNKLFKKIQKIYPLVGPGKIR